MNTEKYWARRASSNHLGGSPGCQGQAGDGIHPGDQSGDHPAAALKPAAMRLRGSTHRPNSSSHAVAKSEHFARIFFLPARKIPRAERNQRMTKLSPERRIFRRGCLVAADLH